MSSSSSHSKNTVAAGFDVVSGKFVRLDLKKWLADNEIVERSRAQGKQEQPDSTREQPDGIHHEIVDFVNRQARGCREQVRKYITLQLETMASLTNEWHHENPEITLETTIKRQINDLDSIGTQEYNHLDVQRADYARASSELNGFREQNRLKRVPQYPLNQVAHWLWVPVAGIVESFVSANLLGGVSRGGTIEGWFIAPLLRHELWAR